MHSVIHHYITSYLFRHCGATISWTLQQSYTSQHANQSLEVAETDRYKASDRQREREKEKQFSLDGFLSPAT